jgi:nitrogen-specific signal transduction histidine kinase/PAS domain-containing protein
MTDAFPLKKLIFALYAGICVSLILLLFMGGRQYQLYQKQIEVVVQTEKLLFQYSIVREHIFNALLDPSQISMRGVSEEMETLHHNLTQLLDAGSVREEVKLSLVSGVDLPGIVLLLREIEAGGGDRNIGLRLSREVRTLGERLMLFDRILVNSSRERLIGYQNIIIGSSALAVAFLVGILILFHRRLLVPLWQLVDDSDQVLAGQKTDVMVSPYCKEASVLAEIINEQEILKGTLFDRLKKCRQVTSDMISALGGVWAEIDDSGKICQVNEEIEFRCGYGVGETANRDWFDFFQPEDDFSHDFKDLAEAGPMECRLVGKDSALDRQMRCIFFYSQCADDSCLIRCIGFDVTDEKAHIRHLQDDLDLEKTKKLELVRVSQLSAIGQLASGVAMEVNNVGNGIINYAQLLEDDMDETAPGTEIVRKIIKQGDTITNLASNLLAYSGDDDGPCEMVLLSHVLGNSITLMKPLLKNDGIEVEVDLQDLPEYHCPAREMQQVVLAILMNSRHALNLKYQTKETDKRIEIKGIRVDSREALQLMITDYGIGIDGEFLGTILKARNSHWPDGQQTGMGLALASDIITNHKGTIEVESELGVSTTVRISLPV